MIKVPSNVKIIGFLGLIPMIFGLLGLIKLSFLSNQINDFLINFAITYAAIILSFLGGCLFGFKTLKDEKPSLLNLFFTVCPSIWASLSLQLPLFKTSSLALGFLLIYEIDRRFFKNSLTPKWWLGLRLPLTSLIIIILVVMGFYV